MSTETFPIIDGQSRFELHAQLSDIGRAKERTWFKIVLGDDKGSPRTAGLLIQGLILVLGSNGDEWLFTGRIASESVDSISWFHSRFTRALTCNGIYNVRTRKGQLESGSLEIG